VSRDRWLDPDAYMLNVFADTVGSLLDWIQERGVTPDEVEFEVEWGYYDDASFFAVVTEQARKRRDDAVADKTPPGSPQSGRRS
jgi:hypothetical protein